MATEDCPFKVVRTNGSDEVLARAINLQIGRAAFETAKRMFPKDLIEYRNGAQIIDRNGGTEANGRRNCASTFKRLAYLRQRFSRNCDANTWQRSHQ